MSHFYGTLKGNRGAATRCGSKDSGMETYCASWNGAVRCYVWYDEIKGKDMVRVEQVSWRGYGEYRILYEGEMGKLGKLPKV